jgi:hypothetical protein
MRTEFEVADALGENVVIGKRYGYTSTEGGYARTTLGEAIKLHPKSGRVTLRVKDVKFFLYGDRIEPYTQSTAEQVVVRSYLLFPIGEEK